MAKTVSSPLNDFPEHQAIIGRLVIGYSDLEAELIALVGNALKIDMNVAVRLVFRARSESQRLALSDAVLRPFYAKHALGGAYSQFYGAIKRCKDIRNQYAHSIWHSRDTDPRFASLDPPAASKEGAAILVFNRVDLTLLREQEEFFGYTEDVGVYLTREGRYRQDRRRKHDNVLPKALRLPKLHNLQD